MTLTVVRQPVGKELGGTLHQRIGLIPQEGFVLRELVVLPQVAREPALHHRPEGGTGHVVVGYGFAPQGRVMVGHHPRAPYMCSAVSRPETASSSIIRNSGS